MTVCDDLINSGDYSRTTRYSSIRRYRLPERASFPHSIQIFFFFLWDGEFEKGSNDSVTRDRERDNYVKLVTVVMVVLVGGGGPTASLEVINTVSHFN